MISTLLTTCVNFDCFKSMAELIEGDMKPPRSIRAIHFFIRRSELFLNVNQLSSTACVQLIFTIACRIKASTVYFRESPSLFRATQTEKTIENKGKFSFFRQLVGTVPVRRRGFFEINSATLGIRFAQII